MVNINIRKSNENDFERIFEIWIQNQKQATGKEIPSTTELELKEELNRLFFHTPHSFFYVAELESKQIIGWQALLPLISNPFIGKYTAQSSTYVERNYLNMDVGSKLFEYALADAKKIGIDHI